jgi:hypothetical protein
MSPNSCPPVQAVYRWGHLKFNDAGKTGMHGSDTNGPGGIILDGSSPSD